MGGGIHAPDSVETIIKCKESFIRANLELGQDVLDAFQQGRKWESPVARSPGRLIEKRSIAKEERIPSSGYRSPLVCGAW